MYLDQRQTTLNSCSHPADYDLARHRTTVPHSGKRPLAPACAPADCAQHAVAINDELKQNASFYSKSYDIEISLIRRFYNLKPVAYH
jgi:hypothetical protein